MTSPDGFVAVDFIELENAADDITNISGRLDTTLDELKSRIAPVIAQWEGGSSEEYQASQSKWDNSAADLQQVLAAIGITTRQSAEDYKITESTNRSRWAG